MSSLLSSAEHYVSLIDKQKILLHFMEAAIGNKKPQDGGPVLSFSACLNSKVEKSVDETFVKYLVRDIEDPDNTVVRLDGVLKSKRGGSELASTKDDLASQVYRSAAVHSLDSLTSKERWGARINTDFGYKRHVRFFLSYRTFTRLLFELRQARNRPSRLVEFLEKEHNRALYWNIFGGKQPIKSDIGFSLELDSKELELLHLRPGKNDVVFKISGQPVQLEGNIYIWENVDKIIVSDIDGTITKSDILGHLYSFVGRDWTHNGVAELFTQNVRNKYKIFYLTARALGQSSTTRNYLRTVSQGSYALPDGPVILSPDSLFGAFYREVIVKRPEDFKIHCLRTIKDLFEGENPFFAGFGNKISDAYTYKVLGIPDNKIYTINPEGKLLAEYTHSLVGTYHTMNEFIGSIFPNCDTAHGPAADHSYSDFAWWRY